MRKMQNSFKVTGFIAKDAEIRQFTSASVARFPLSVSRREKVGDDFGRVSSLISIEAWRKNEEASGFDILAKGEMITVEGYFKPEEWVDQDGIRRNRVLMVATSFFPTPDDEADVPDPKKAMD